ncbi:MAG: LPS assembly protein LptD [Syntrophales bacterium]|nr:LPS assembly protein LptD [Syntrophales bacterium]
MILNRGDSYHNSAVFIIKILVLLFFFSVHDSFAKEGNISKGPVNIEADSIAYNRAEDTYRAEGNVFIKFSGGVITADSVVLNKAANNALAQGHVMMKSEGDILEGERVIFDIATKKGVVYRGKVFMEKNHFYLGGEKIEKKSETTYNIKEATVTTCDGDAPDWQLTARELDVTVDGYGTLKHGKFLVKGFPLLYIPYLIFPAKTTRQSGFLFPRIAYSLDRHGLDIELPFYWAISESADATFYQRYMEKRGWKEGVEFRYFIGDDSWGTFYGDFLNDVKQTAETSGDISRNWPSDQKRWSFYLNHETTFSKGFYLRTDIAKVSDNWYFKDFSSSNYYLDHYSNNEESYFKKISFFANESLGSLDSTARLVKDWQLYNLTGLVSYTDDFRSASNEATLQKYPEIRLTGIKQPFFDTPLNFELAASYDYYYRTEGQKGHLYDIKPAISLPVNLGGYLQLTPEMAVKETFWDQDGGAAANDNKNGDLKVWNAGVSLTTEFHRIFDVSGETMEKIRHSVKSELTYAYAAVISQDNNRPDFVTEIAGENNLAYALINTLTARVKGKDGQISYRELLRLKLAQTYDIEEARRDVADQGMGRIPFSDLEVELDCVPSEYFSFRGRNRFSVNSGEWKQTNYDLYLNDWRGDTVTFGYRYTQNSLEETNFSLKAPLTGAMDVTYVMRKNLLDGEYLERTYGFNYHKQCWNVALSYSDGENDRRFMISFSLYGLGRSGGR